MGFFDSILDWAADKVQTATGEKERRQLVAEFKSEYTSFKEKIHILVDNLNKTIMFFNEKIKELNSLRKGKVKNNINELSVFLKKFGNVKDAGEYSSELTRQLHDVPNKRFEEVKNYITDIDWSKDDVFINTFFLSPIGMKIKTRNQNLSMREQLHEFKIESEETAKMLEERRFFTNQDKIISEIYIDCVKYISSYIENIILPELELVESFFQAEKIKDEVIAGNELVGLKFKNNINILKDSIYGKHYLFVKNTFMFYVISCKIYNTPVLTKLLKSDLNTTKDDLKLLEKQRQALITQGNSIKDNLVINK